MDCSKEITAIMESPNMLYVDTGDPKKLFAEMFERIPSNNQEILLEQIEDSILITMDRIRLFSEKYKQGKDDADEHMTCLLMIIAIYRICPEFIVPGEDRDETEDVIQSMLIIKRSVNNKLPEHDKAAALSEQILLLEYILKEISEKNIDQTSLDMMVINECDLIAEMLNLYNTFR